MSLKPHEIARRIVALLAERPQPRREIDDLAQELTSLVSDDEVERLLRQAAGPEIH